MKKLLLSERFKRPPKHLTFETYLREQDNPISSHPEARDPRIVPLVTFDYGSTMARVRQSRYVGKYLVASVKEMAKSAKSVLKNPYAGEKNIDADTLKELEAYAYSLGVTDIGYTKVDPHHIFRGYKLLFPNAMVLTMQMDREKIKQAPSMGGASLSTGYLISCANAVSMRWLDQRSVVMSTTSRLRSMREWAIPVKMDC